MCAYRCVHLWAPMRHAEGARALWGVGRRAVDAGLELKVQLGMLHPCYQFTLLEAARHWASPAPAFGCCGEP